MHPSLSLSKSYLVQIQRVVLVDGFDAKIHSFVTYLPSTLIMVLEFMFDPHLAFTPRAQIAQIIILQESGSSREGMEEGMAHFRLNCCSLAAVMIFATRARERVGVLSVGGQEMRKRALLGLPDSYARGTWPMWA